MLYGRESYRRTSIKKNMSMGRSSGRNFVRQTEIPGSALVQLFDNRIMVKTGFQRVVDYHGVLTGLHYFFHGLPPLYVDAT